jgi:beta-lactam-binding protein with PASTA domain
LAKRTDERYQSAADMRNDIERVLAGHAVAPPSAPSPGSATAVAAVDALSGLSGSPNTTQVTQAVPASTATDASTLPPPSRRKQSSGRSKFAFWALALIALALLSTAAWAFLGQDAAPPAEKIAVPDVSGEPYDDAKAELESVNFAVEKNEEPDDTVPTGDVISQDPAGGSLMEAGTTITLTVSTGKETVTMPALGSYTFDDAKNLLESDQYQLKVEKEERDSSSPADEVINSNPPEGSEVEKGSTVTLYVSRGEKSVPNVVGKSVSDAKNTLEDAGFDVDVSGPDDGTVTDQDPNAGDDLSPGETVKITSEAKDKQGPKVDELCVPPDTDPDTDGCQS